MCHLASECYYAVSQSADISLCTSRIRSLKLLSHCSWSGFHRQIIQHCDVLTSCEPAEMVQLGGGSGYCISAETAGIRCTTHGPPNLLVLVFKYCACLVVHCHGSLSHELQCLLLGYINVEPLTLPVVCTSVSYSVVQNSSRGCGTPIILLSLDSYTHIYHFDKQLGQNPYPAHFFNSHLFIHSLYIAETLKVSLTKPTYDIRQRLKRTVAGLSN